MTTILAAPRGRLWTCETCGEQIDADDPWYWAEDEYHAPPSVERVRHALKLALAIIRKSADYPLTSRRVVVAKVTADVAEILWRLPGPDCVGSLNPQAVRHALVTTAMTHAGLPRHQADLQDAWRDAGWTFQEMEDAR